jgi:hypothetical protein
MARCKSAMWRNGQYVTPDSFPQIKEELLSDFNASDVENLSLYFHCLSRVESMLRDCARSWLDRECSSSNVRIVKTVRAGMESPGYFLKEYDAFKLLHLFRDPRGVVNSRFVSNWATSKEERKNVTRIAQRYCQNVLADYWTRKSLELRFPEQVFELISDDFMARPLYYVTALSQLFNYSAATQEAFVSRLQKAGIIANVTQLVTTEAVTVETVTKPGADFAAEKLSVADGRKLRGQRRIRKWERMLDRDQVTEIQKTCHEFYSNIQRVW